LNGSLKLGSVLGITIRVHVLLLVLFGFVVLRAQAAFMAGLLIVTLFGIVLLHELAHSVVAMRFGMKVLDITLWPLGGMARMSEIPESSRIEGWVAIAGPALNFVLAAIAFPFWLHANLYDTASATYATWISYFFVANVGLGGFNLIPAFPMDGGRLLRAFLGRNGDWLGATERAVRVGRVLAFGLALFGCLTVGFLGLQSVSFVLVALFVWWAGSQELHAVRARHGLDPLAAFRAFAARATGWTQTPTQTEYARAPAGAVPPRHAPPGGFSESEIERLEHFRGPLRSFPADEA